MIITNTISFDADIIPAIGKCLASYICFFYGPYRGSALRGVFREQTLDSVVQKISVHKHSDAKWFASTWKTRVVHIAFMQRLLQLKSHWSTDLAREMPHFLPLAVWFHSMLEERITLQYGLLKAIIEFDEFGKIYLCKIPLDAIAQERTRMAQEQQQAKINRILPPESSVKQARELRRRWIRSFLIEVRSVPADAEPSVALVFKDIISLHQTLSKDFPDGEHCRFIREILAEVTALCPKILYDQVNFSACDMNRIFDFFLERRRLRSRNELRLKYFLHGLAATGALFTKQPYFTKFLALVDAVFASANIHQFNPAAGVDPAVADLVAGLTLPSLHRFSLYATTAVVSSSDALQQQAPRPPTPVEASLTNAIRPVREFVLSKLLPFAIRGATLPRRKLAIVVFSSQIFFEAFKQSSNHFSFEKEFAAFALTACTALSRDTMSVRTFLLKLSIHRLLTLLVPVLCERLGSSGVVL